MENKLSERDQQILNQLIDSNTIDQAQYTWNEDFQRVVLGLLLCDRYFFCQSLSLIKPNYFRNEIHQVVSKILLTYFEKYRHLPSKIFIKQEIEDWLGERYTGQKDILDAMLLRYKAEIEIIYEYYTKGGIGDVIPALDSIEAVLDKVTIFARTQAVKYAFHKALELIRSKPESDETWAKVDEIVREARLVNRQIDLGLDYFQTVEERYDRMANAEQYLEVFSTGFDTIDRALYGGGLVRGEIGAVMAKPGTGKSLNLVNATAKNLLNGKKVLYISTEMNQDRVASRFDAVLTSVGQNNLLTFKEDVWKSLKNQTDDYEDKRRLCIKQFSSGSADMNTVRAYQSQLSMAGFRPDLLIVDYPGDMKDYPGIATWESRFRLLRDLRGFGVDENHCTLVAMQPNRSSSQLTIEEFLDEGNQGDSFNQNRVLDLFWTLNQTLNEQKAHLGRVYVAKARNGKCKFHFYIKYGYADQTLYMREITKENYKSILGKASTTNGKNDVKIDDMHVHTDSD